MEKLCFAKTNSNKRQLERSGKSAANRFEQHSNWNKAQISKDTKKLETRQFGKRHDERSYHYNNRREISLKDPPHQSSKSSSPSSSNTQSNKSKPKNLNNDTESPVTWRFGTANIRSGKQKYGGEKMYKVAYEASRGKIDILSLQEVRWKSMGSKLISLNNIDAFKFFWCGPDDKHSSDVGILVRLGNNIICENPDFSYPIVIAINISVGGFTIRIISAYGPTNCDPCQAQKEDFYYNIQQAIRNNKNTYPILIGADFNAVTAATKFRSYFDGTKPTLSEETNENGRMMDSFAIKNHLSLSSTFFKRKKDDHRFTWLSNDGRFRKTLDHILAGQYIQKYTTECKVHPHLDFQSDHSVLVSDLKTPKFNTKVQRNKKSHRTNNTVPPPKKEVSLLKDPATETMLINIMVSNFISNKAAPAFDPSSSFTPSSTSL